LTNKGPDLAAPPGFLLYQTEDGRMQIACRLEDETLWLSQAQMAELFQTTPQNITLHLKAIYQEGEQSEAATCKEYLQVRTEGNRSVSREVKHYRLEAVLAVGFRVRGHRGTQFRQWATERLREYLVKGFAMDDARLKDPSGSRDEAYFEELLARIRDIRSSEKVFYRKVLEIYATSIDYDPNVEASQLFFKTVQNKMHWAAHGHTAAELVALRADAQNPNMGLTSWPGSKPRKADVTSAKNYLQPEELEVLKRVVTAYLEFAELQARNGRPMYMADWISKLDDFLRLADHEVPKHAGKISHEVATLKALQEYDSYSSQRAALPAPVESHFEQALAETKQLEKAKTVGNKKKDAR
jgi:hypothetical protein